MKYRTAIVTGASSGIGEAIAVELVTHGVTVYGLARNHMQLKKIKAGLPRSLQAKFNIVVCDITDAQQVKKTLRQVFQKQHVDLLVNNAGIGFSRDFVEFTDEEIDAVINTNLRGTITVTQEALQLKKPDDFLQIVNVTSLAGKMGFPNLSVYSATKFALEGLTEALRSEYSHKNVRFTVLRPGITHTNFFSKAGMESYQDSVKDLSSYYAPTKVAAEFVRKLDKNRREIIVGNDKLFIRLLPFIPFNQRFRVLDLVNKL